MMTFTELTGYFERLEKTSSRLALIDILAELFGQVSPNEMAKVIYLLQGRVAPFYEPIEIGMAEKSVAAAIAKAFSVSKEAVLDKFSELGDLGECAQVYASKQAKSSQIDTNVVFNKLLQIANITGQGTVENKQVVMVELLKQMDSISAKHLVRIPLGTSRLGIGDPTILDAFAQIKLGGRQNRAVLEQAYNRISDLGLIGETLFEKGTEEVEKLTVSVGRPIRPQLCERLPDSQTILEKMNGKVHLQFKYDGFRTQLHLDRSKSPGEQVRIFSRNLEETTKMFPELIKGVLEQVKADQVILDAEALAFNPTSEEFLPFQETTKRRRKYDIEEMSQKLPLRSFVFDIMYLNGQSLIDQPLEERIEALKNTVSGDEILIPQPGEITTSIQKVDELFNDALSKGLEGLVIKRPDSKYAAGARNFNWVKLKRHSAGELKDTIDCVILGYIFGRGKRAEFGAGALLVGVYDAKQDKFVTVSKIGTGLTDEEWKEVHQRADKIKVDHKPARVDSILEPTVWIEPEIVIEVLADEITQSPVHTAGKIGDEPGFALRFPRLVRFRESDRRAEDATTVKELLEMYQQQGKK